jgi:uncharacterized protein YdcH (DUF465 family)
MNQGFAPVSLPKGGAMLKRLFDWLDRLDRRSHEAEMNRLRAEYARLDHQIREAEKGLEQADLELTRLSVEKAKLEGGCHLRRVK